MYNLEDFRNRKMNNKLRLFSLSVCDFTFLLFLKFEIKQFKLN
jgi:hypothetical protein